MIVKIFLREFTYIYRGEIENRKIREYIKTITKRSFIIKWKDQDDELITISQKQDIIYFYKIQQSNLITKNTPFKLYIQEIFSDTQNYQSSSQIQIGSKLQSPQQKSSNLKQPQNYSYFLFGQSNDQTVLQKSQEIPKENNFIKQYYDLVPIEEKQDSYHNFSEKALDNKLAYSFSDKQNQYSKSLQQQQIQNETPSSLESYDIYQSLPESSYRPSINFEQIEESPKKNKFNEASKILDIKRINEESQILQSDKVDLNQKSEIQQLEERQELINKEIFCDFCSLLIEFKDDDKTILYGCEFCEDYHICSICYNDQQESVHFHQLHSI